MSIDPACVSEFTENMKMPASATSPARANPSLKKIIRETMTVEQTIIMKMTLPRPQLSESRPKNGPLKMATAVSNDTYTPMARAPISSSRRR